MPQSWDMGKILLLHLKFVRKIKTHILYSTPPPYFLKKCVVYETIGKKNMAGTDRPQMAIWRMRMACWITKATDTLSMCSNYCFSMAKMVTRTRLNVTYYAHCPSCCIFQTVAESQFYRRYTTQNWIARRPRQPNQTVQYSTVQYHSIPQPASSIHFSFSKPISLRSILSSHPLPFS